MSGKLNQLDQSPAALVCVCVLPVAGVNNHPVPSQTAAAVAVCCACAQAGARKVYAVEASGMANFARQLAERNPSIGKALQVSGWVGAVGCQRLTRSRSAASDLEGWAEGGSPKGPGLWVLQWWGALHWGCGRAERIWPLSPNAAPNPLPRLVAGLAPL